MSEAAYEQDWWYVEHAACEIGEKCVAEDGTNCAEERTP